MVKYKDSADHLGSRWQQQERDRIHRKHQCGPAGGGCERRVDPRWGPAWSSRVCVGFRSRPAERPDGFGGGVDVVYQHRQRPGIAASGRN